MRKIVLISGMLLGINASSIFAQSPFPSELSLEGKVAQSELIFQGTVQKIDYQPSTDGIPHTFVTYSVDDLIAGQYSKKNITLRFIGGFMEKNNQVIQLQVSHAPSFKEGESGVLMVQGNNQAQCPLVRCSAGLYRFDNNKVSDASGNLLSMPLKDGIIRLAPAMSDESIESHRPAEGLAEHNTTPKFAVSAQQKLAINKKDFVSHLKSLVSRQKKSNKLQSFVSVKSADIKKPFNGPKVLVGKAPEPIDSSVNTLSARAEKSAGNKSAFDRWEEEQLKKNGGNPVLNSRFDSSEERSVNSLSKKHSK